MRFVLYTVTPSPHQFPLAQKIVAQIGSSNFRYIYRNPLSEERKRQGWGTGLPVWCISLQDSEALDWLLNAEFLLSGERDVALFGRRSLVGRLSYYSSERWFKPWAGILRLLHPRYFGMAWRFVRLIRAKWVVYLPKGVWAARDMARLVSLFSGDLRCLFRPPQLKYKSQPGGLIDGYSWMRMWGYFVAPTSPFPAQESDDSTGHGLRVLWVGRLLRLKSVDTLFKAVYAANKVTPMTLTIVGEGPERKRLNRLDANLARRYGTDSRTTFHPSVPVNDIRLFMRNHDVYVLPSNAYEGWGAVVSEALEEKMEVFGSYEAGSSATILPNENLFHSGDWRELCNQLVRYAQTGERHCHGIGSWCVDEAGDYLLNVVSYSLARKDSQE